MKNNPPILPRRAAIVAGVQVISCEPGTSIFDAQTGERLGIVMNGLPVVNEDARTCYLSTDDYNAARDHINKRSLQ